MKRPFLKIGLVIMLLAVLSISVSARSQVSASILRYEPAPAEQGNVFDVYVQITNVGTQAKDVAIQFVPEYPFTLADERSYRDIDVIGATEEVIEKFSVIADVNAPNGEHDIKFLYKYDSENWIQLEEPITLETQNAALIVKEYAVEPEQIIPGQTAKVTLKLENIGSISVKNVDVQLDLDDSKFSTIGTGSVQRLSTIGAGRQAVVTFNIASDTSTEVKLYNIPVMISYQDTKNKEYDTTAKISMLMNAEPAIEVIVDEAQFPAQKTPGIVSLQVINRGIGNIKYATMRLIGSPEYEILSPSNLAYVGNLDSDDFENVDFKIKPKVENPEIQVELEYKDEYNVDFKESYTLPMKIFSAKELGKSSTPWMLILFVIAAVIVGVVYFRKRMKKHAK